LAGRQEVSALRIVTRSDRARNGFRDELIGPMNWAVMQRKRETQLDFFRELLDGRDLSSEAAA
jgi:hypothetical protein